MNEEISLQEHIGEQPRHNRIRKEYTALLNAQTLSARDLLEENATLSYRVIELLDRNNDLSSINVRIEEAFKYSETTRRSLLDDNVKLRDEVEELSTLHAHACDRIDRDKERIDKLDAKASLLEEGKCACDACIREFADWKN